MESWRSWDAARGARDKLLYNALIRWHPWRWCRARHRVLCVWDGDILLLDYSSGRIVRDL